MPSWISWVLPIVLNLLRTYGVPAIERQWPSLTPIIEEILLILGGKPPTLAMHSAAKEFNVCSGIGCVPEVKKD